MEILRYSQLGREDIRFGKGTFEARLANGQVVTLQEVDVGAILADSALSTPAIGYLTGTWTPSVGGNATYIRRVGQHTKVGNVVTISCDLAINVLGTGSTTEVSNLPYPVQAGCFFTAPVYFGTLASTVVYVIAFASGGQTTCSLRAIQAAGASLLSSVAILGDGAEIAFGGSYLTE